MIKLSIWNSATWFKHINTLVSLNGMQSSILCLFFATCDISNPISKWKHESLWTWFVRRVMRPNFNARAKFLVEIFNFIHSKLLLRPGFFGLFTTIRNVTLWIGIEWCNESDEMFSRRARVTVIEPRKLRFSFFSLSLHWRDGKFQCG